MGRIECRRWGREFLVRAEMILGMLCVSGVTVCVLALATLQPGTVGNTLLLTRLEKDNPPVTVQIPTAQSKVGFLGQQAKLGWGRLLVKLLISRGWGDGEVVITWTSRKLTVPSPKASSEFGPERV